MNELSRIATKINSASAGMNEYFALLCFAQIREKFVGPLIRGTSYPTYNLEPGVGRRVFIGRGIHGSQVQTWRSDCAMSSYLPQWEFGVTGNHQ